MPSTAAMTIEERIAPTTATGVADAVRAAHATRTPVYPVGGGTALDYGIAPLLRGNELDLTGLAKIVDYTPRDMTIVVEAGVRMAELAAVLAVEGQQLPIDVPRSSQATIGGVVATNWNGPRRFGYGTIRDYVIGIHAVDGRGVAFKGGGRVVKNVAGYDFCKLLTGSLGALAVITQLALKLKPRPEHNVTVAAACRHVAGAEEILARLAKLAAPPAAIDLVIGGDWQVPVLHSSAKSASRADACVPLIIVRLEGTELETTWLADHVVREISQGGASAVCQLEPAVAEDLWSKQVEFADSGAGLASAASPLAIKIAVPPNTVTQIINDLLAFDSDCAIQAHAASGIIYA
ncbi:MAG TPA: FAD-binding protein, partial [Lacipirellulaceae bacterium]|nr:FAD-binding protein [Lacipirellulaceae bacterium]